MFKPLWCVPYIVFVYMSCCVPCFILQWTSESQNKSSTTSNKCINNYGTLWLHCRLLKFSDSFLSYHTHTQPNILPPSLSLTLIQSPSFLPPSFPHTSKRLDYLLEFLLLLSHTLTQSTSFLPPPSLSLTLVQSPSSFLPPSFPTHTQTFMRSLRICPLPGCHKVLLRWSQRWIVLAYKTHYTHCVWARGHICVRTICQPNWPSRQKQAIWIIQQEC